MVASLPRSASRFALTSTTRWSGFALLLAVSFSQGSPAQLQGAPAAASCTLNKGVYTCSWPLFRTAFDSAHTVAVETQHIDRQADAQLRHLLSQLGKTAASADAPADLNMLLIPVDPTGVDFGPADHDLATLRVYAPNGATPHGTLLWAETYRGQGDRPWPSVVHALISQFQARFPKP